MRTADMPFGYGRWLRLPDAMRTEVREPLGRLVDGETFRKEASRTENLVTVGDYCTSAALDADARPKVAVVDLQVERRESRGVMARPFAQEATRVPVENPAGHLSPDVWDALRQAYSARGPVLIHVEGEEDLVALPAIALAPNGFTVAYGMPGEGVVIVSVDDTSRARVEDVLSRMEVVHGG